MWDDFKLPGFISHHCALFVFVAGITVLRFFLLLIMCTLGLRHDLDLTVFIHHRSTLPVFVIGITELGDAFGVAGFFHFN